jgi:nucleoside-diphosphate-sugar epimerase
MKILVTGAAGFIGEYLVRELCTAGHEVVGLDDFSKYGERPCFRHPRYELRRGDARDVELLRELLHGCDQFVAGAAKVGGIAYFHRFAYDLLAENFRITAAAFDAAIEAHRQGALRKITVLSSSMVYENTTVFPTPEGEERRCPPPSSTYGFSKLGAEMFARAARDQHGLPFTIVRPFNCVGAGEGTGVGGHVLPDLVYKLLSGEDPLPIFGSGEQVRCYTYGGDLARGIRVCIEHPEAQDEDFNLSSPVPTSVLELAAKAWRAIRGDEPLRWVSVPPFRHDVARRIPAVDKAARRLGFRAETPLDEVLGEVIAWVRGEMQPGGP